MLASTLTRLIEEKRTSAQQIADLTGVAPSTVYRWMSGESEPDFNAIRLLLRHLPDRSAQSALIQAFLTGTPWRVEPLESELDINHDGRIDTNDALDACILAVQSAGQSLSEVREACRDGKLGATQTGKLVGLLNEVVRECSICQQVLTRLTAPRPKARQV